VTAHAKGPKRRAAGDAPYQTVSAAATRDERPADAGGTYHSSCSICPPAIMGVHPWINPGRAARLERSRKKKSTRTCQGERVPPFTLSTNVPS